MTAFEITLNGKRICVAGIEREGVVAAHLCWVRRQKTYRRNQSSEELSLEVGGLDTATGDSLRWVEQLKVSEGDEVRIRVLKVSRVSKAKRQKRESPADRVRSEKRYVRQLAKQLGWKIVTR